MTTYQLAQLFLTLAIIIVLARVFGAVARRLGQPAVLGELTAGILAGPTLLSADIRGMLFPASIGTALAALANVALVLFMFCVGLELDQSLLKGRGRVAVAVSVGSIVVPFGLAVGPALWMAGNHGVSDRLPFVLFIGAAMSVTAFPVLARILTDRKMNRLEIGGLALASAAVDDVVAWGMLAFVTAIGGYAAGGQWEVTLVVPYVLLMVLVVRPLLRKACTVDGRPRPLTPGLLSLVLAGLLLSSYATERIGIHFIFGAFLYGAMMPKQGFAEFRRVLVERIEPVSGTILLPVFFVISGMRVDLSSVGTQGLAELAVILAVAVGGKFGGAYLCARSAGLGGRQSGTLASLMNTRGLTEIVFLTVGLQHSIIDRDLFSLMVVMAIVTTAMAGPLLHWFYPRRLVERDLAAVTPEPVLAAAAK